MRTRPAVDAAALSESDLRQGSVLAKCIEASFDSDFKAQPSRRFSWSCVALLAATLFIDGHGNIMNNNNTNYWGWNVWVGAGLGLGFISWWNRVLFLFWEEVDFMCFGRRGTQYLTPILCFCHFIQRMEDGAGLCRGHK